MSPAIPSSKFMGSTTGPFLTIAFSLKSICVIQGHTFQKIFIDYKKLNMPYDDDNSSPQPKQESTMSSGPDWNWIGYMNSFDNESGNGGGGGGGACGCLSVLIIIGV